MVGAVELYHRPSRFHPDRYGFDVWVLPDRRRRGHGSALHDAAVAILRERNALAATAGVKESMTDGVEFTQKRGWVEVKRDWESRLVVGGVRLRQVRRRRRARDRTGHPHQHVRRRARQRPRCRAEGVRAHRPLPPRRSGDGRSPPTSPSRNGRRTGSTRRASSRTPSTSPSTSRAVGSVCRTCKGPLRTPPLSGRASPGYVARRAARASRWRSSSMTVRYAQRLGVDHIKTWNDQRNQPMLAINVAMGFARQPAWIGLELRLRP